MGYGSRTYTVSATVTGAATTSDVTLVSAGRCTFDGIIVSVGNVPTDLTVTIKDAAGATIHAWQFDPTGSAAVRDGIRSGPNGMGSVNGLKFSVTNNGSTGLVALTMLYRDGFA